MLFKLAFEQFFCKNLKKIKKLLFKLKLFIVKLKGKNLKNFCEVIYVYIYIYSYFPILEVLVKKFV